MIKLFVSDMDGTLLYDAENLHSREITLENREAVLKLHASGIRFMMASGRDHLFRLTLEKEFGFQIDAIGMNGCNVVIDNQVLCDHSMTYQDTRDILAVLKDAPEFENFLAINSRGDYVFLHTDGEAYGHFKEAFEKGIFRYVSGTLLEDWIKDPAQPPFNKLVGMVKNIHERDALLAFFNARFKDRFDIIYSGRENIEIMPKNISKGSALLELMALKGYQPTEVAVIGDSMNDLTMLQVSPFSFSMSHAEDIIRSSSKYVVHDVAQAVEMVLKHNREEAKHAH